MFFIRAHFSQYWIQNPDVHIKVQLVPTQTPPLPGKAPSFSRSRGHGRNVSEPPQPLSRMTHLATPGIPEVVAAAPLVKLVLYVRPEVVFPRVRSAGSGGGAAAAERGKVAASPSQRRRFSNVFKSFAGSPAAGDTEQGMVNHDSTSLHLFFFVSLATKATRRFLTFALLFTLA